ncbi:MAG: mechanosensitive ion channel family protein [Vicinamibacteria bacterium]
MEALGVRFEDLWASISGWFTSPQFYVQLGTVVAAMLLAFLAALLIKRRAVVLKAEPKPGPWHTFRSLLFQTRDLLFPAMSVLLLGISIEIAAPFVDQSWLIRFAQSLALVFLLYTVIARFVDSSLMTGLLKWVGIPLATLHVFGWLDDLTNYLDGISFEVGNIRLSAYAAGRTLFFGTILFWLGRISNSTGKRVIRSQPQLDVGTREVIAKLFEISIFALVFLLLLQVMGINLTALAVFSGALGVGIGFGLQKIAANFVSGIIILMDRSITLGDYIELEDGRAGTLREMNMRSATLETFDGKDIVVPNEAFVATAFTNWTHYNKMQRYSLEFSVAYRTDLPPMFERVREVVASHPQVIPGPDEPDGECASVEIDSFGDSGINIQVEYWMEGVDDGPNNVKADLLLMIWAALREHDIEMPFPQREISILTKDG